MSKTIVYIAGPMTGLPAYNYPLFNRHAAELRENGFEVLNPAENFEGRSDLCRETYLREALEQVMSAEEMYVLPGWDTHRLGASFARTEVSIALGLGMELWGPGWDPVEWEVERGLRGLGRGRFKEIVESLGAKPKPKPKPKPRPKPGPRYETSSIEEIIRKERIACGLWGEAPAGQGQDEPVEVTKDGGKHSKIPERCDLLPAGALLAAAQVLHEGAERYNDGDDENPNWRKIPIRDHINHLLAHLLHYLSGDRSTDHLGHAVCRSLFAKDLEGKTVSSSYSGPV